MLLTLFALFAFTVLCDLWAASARELTFDCFSAFRSNSASFSLFSAPPSASLDFPMASFAKSSQSASALSSSSSSFASMIKAGEIGDSRQRTTSPIVTGTTVLGMKYKGGVMLAADTLASYGSMARYKDVRRIRQVGESTLIGASGEISDFQVCSS